MKKKIRVHHQILHHVSKVNLHHLQSLIERCDKQTVKFTYPCYRKHQHRLTAVAINVDMILGSTSFEGSTCTILLSCAHNGEHTSHCQIVILSVTTLNGVCEFHKAG